MEIERINENTVKFYISYTDIEDRGFEREEIWYNRERSEQLFWQMMDEVNYKEDFSTDGPLWIQVKVLDKGLEIVVSKESPNIDLEEFMETENKPKFNVEMTPDNLEELFKKKYSKKKEEEKDNNHLWMIVSFQDLEDVIQFSHHLPEEAEENILQSSLYHYEDKYHIYIEISEFAFELQEDVMQVIFHYASEYGQEEETTMAMLEEYGKLVMEQDVFEQVRHYFDLK
ncbi:MAG TPA: adaptor protein MecA [Pseudogracilibacillus sp.]|nr:adaptor protein MecA [Pseudogracilibacillus sp.]